MFLVGITIVGNDASLKATIETKTLGWESLDAPGSLKVENGEISYYYHY